MPTDPLLFALRSAGLALALFLGMLLCLEAGRRLGARQLAKHGPKARTGVGAVDAAVYGLLALLIGFTFNGAATRFDQRRLLIADEANAIGTAWQRVDLLPSAAQPPIRAGLQRYLDALIAAYTEPPASVDPLREPPALTIAQNDVWSRSVAASLAPGGEPARLLLLGSLNEVFGLVEKERMARWIHPPLMIFVMLGLSALSAAMFVGYGIADGQPRNWIYIVGVALTISVATYVIIDLEYPRLGLIRVDPMHRALTDLRATMR